MPPTLILLAHPALEKSRANRTLAEAASGLEGVTLHDLYERYPHFEIDRRAEQELLERHERVVLQHPFYWYSTPSLMKEWFDVVLEYGWAYSRGGNALFGKTCRSVVTTGGTRDAYCSRGHNRYSVEELLRPVEQTAQLCGMDYQPPLVVYGALHLDDAALSAAAAEYRDWLTSA